LNEQITFVNNSFSETNTRITTIRDDLTSLTDHVAEETTLIKKDVSANKADTDASLEIVRTDITGLNSNFIGLDERTAAIRSEFDTLNAYTTTNVPALEEDLSAARLDYSAKIALAISRIDATDSNVAELDTRVTTNVETIAADVQSYKDETATKFETVDSSISTVSDELTSAKDSLTESISEVRSDLNSNEFLADKFLDNNMYERGPNFDDILSVLYSGGSTMEISPDAADPSSFWMTFPTNTTAYSSPEFTMEMYWEFYEGILYETPGRNLQEVPEVAGTPEKTGETGDSKPKMQPKRNLLNSGYESLYQDMFLLSAEEFFETGSSSSSGTTNSIFIGLGLQSNDNGMIVNIPEGYDVLSLHVQTSAQYPKVFDDIDVSGISGLNDASVPHPWLCHLKGNWTDTGDVIGSWGGNINSFGLVYQGNLEPKKGQSTHGYLNIPTKRSGKLLLYSGENNACRITGFSFAKNLHGHAATYPAIFMASYNGGNLMNGLEFLSSLFYYYPTQMFKEALPLFKIPVVNNGKNKLFYFTNWIDSTPLISPHNKHPINEIFESAPLGPEFSTLFMANIWMNPFFQNGPTYTNSYLPFMTTAFEAGVLYTAVNDVTVDFRTDISNSISRSLSNYQLRYNAVKIDASMIDEDWVDFEISSPFNVAIIEIGTHDADVL